MEDCDEEPYADFVRRVVYLAIVKYQDTHRRSPAKVFLSREEADALHLACVVSGSIAWRPFDLRTFELTPTYLGVPIAIAENATGLFSEPA